MKRTSFPRILLVFSVFMLSSLCPLRAQASSSADVPYVAIVKRIYEGKLQVTEARGAYALRGSSRIPLMQGSVLNASDILVTERDSEILLEYRNKNTIYIKGNTRAQLKQDTLVYQNKGEILYRLFGAFKIDTDDETTQVSGTQFSINRIDATTEIIVIDGEVRVGKKGSSSFVTISNGKKRLVSAGKAGDETEVEITTRILLDEQFKRIFVTKDEESLTQEKLNILEDNSLVEKSTLVKTKRVEYTAIEISYWRTNGEKEAILRKLEASGESIFDLSKFEDCRALAELYYSRGDFDAALSVYEKAFLKASTLAEKAAIDNNMGLCYYKKGDFDSAISAIGKGIKLQGDSAELHSNLAICYAAKGYDDLAQSEHDIAVRIKNANSEILNNLASRYFLNGEYREAEQNYLRIIAMNNRFAKAYAGLAWIYSEWGNYAEVRKVYESAVRNMIDDPDLNAVMADSSFMEGEYSKAGAFYQKALLAARYETADTRFNIGLCLDLQGDMDKALAEYRKALALNPLHTSSNINSGFIYHSRKEYAKALSCYEKALSVEPNNAMALNNTGVVFLDAGDFGKAIDYFGKVIGIKKDSASGYANRGIARIQIGRNEEAIEDLLMALRLKDSLLSVYYNLAIAYENLGKFEKAIEYYRTCLEKNIMADYVNFYLGAILLKIKKPGEATPYLERALVKLSENKELLFAMGIAYGQIGERGKSISSYEKAIVIDPGFTEAYFNLGYLYYRADEFLDARRCFVIAKQFNPKDAETAYILGLTYYELGDYAKAVKEFEEVRRSGKESFPELAKTLGNSYYKLKQFENAQQYFEAYVRLNPADASAFFNLGVVRYDRSDLPGAADCFRQCISLDPKFEEAYTNLAVVLNSLGKFNETEKIMKDAMRILGNKKTYAGILADAYVRASRYGDAVPLLESLTAEAGGEADLLFELAMCYAELDSYEKALDAYQRLIEKSPEFSSAFFNLGVLYYNHRDFYNCRVYLSRFIALEKEGKYFEVAKEILGSIP